jgi:hypothetical protein
MDYFYIYGVFRLYGLTEVIKQLQLQCFKTESLDNFCIFLLNICSIALENVKFQDIGSVETFTEFSNISHLDITYLYIKNNHSLPYAW